MSEELPQRDTLQEYRIPQRVSLLEYRMDKAENAGNEYRKSLQELSGTLSKLSKNIDQIKWVVIGAVVASMGSGAIPVLLKLVGM